MASALKETYRVKKISIRRGWAIDQIKFEYDDDKTWSVGIDGGRKDNREFIMTPGEYLVRVTHETLQQRWYAGASVEFETNKGRIIQYSPYIKTGLKENVVTKRAETGNEIVMLKIKHGKLEDIVQQPVPPNEISTRKDSWYVSISGPGSNINEFDQKEEAVAYCFKQSGVVIDVTNNKVVYQNCNDDILASYKKAATNQGYLIGISAELGGISDIVNIFRKHFNLKEDLFLFLTTLFLLTSSSYISTYADLISGYALSSFMSTTQMDSVQLSFPHMICDTLVSCDKGNGTSNALIISLLIAKLVACLFQSGNLFFHSILKESRLVSMRKSLFKHTLKQEMAFFDERTPEDIRASMDPTVILDIIAWKIPYFVAEIFKVIFVLYYMFQLSWQLSLFSLVFLGFFNLLTLPTYKKYEMLIKLEDKIYMMVSQAQRESVSMISSVKHFSKEPLHLGEQSTALDQMEQLNYKKNFFRFLHDFILTSFNTTSLCLSLLIINSYGTTINLDSGKITAFFLLFTQIYSLFDAIHNWYKDLISQIPIAERVSLLMDKKPTLKDGPLEPASLSGKIEFKDVSFTYPSRPGQEVIKNLNLVLQPGKVTAVVGDSGAGKSTLTNLLMRLYDPTSGNIFVDGYNLKELKLSNYHQNVSVVNQNPLLFNSSIGENIAYGSVKDNATKEEIESAAKQANAYDFIMSFRGGFDTLAGTLGTQLSGGQKQRLAIARAIIRNPNILILDEATSSLDAENEKIVSDALDNVKEGRTTLVIAHRLSTIRDADEILVMKEGSVVEKGTHNQLIELNGAYKKLISKQLEQLREE